MTLNNIGVLIKGVVIDLRVRNFVHAKISLRARCAQARHRVRSLSSSNNLNGKNNLDFFERYKYLSLNPIFSADHFQYRNIWDIF